MKKETKEMLKSNINNNLDTFNHTVEVITDVLVSNTKDKSIKSKMKILDAGEVENQAIINLNKYADKKITRYSDFDFELNKLILENNVKNYQFKRFDLAINFYDDESFVNYYKLNNYLLNLISFKYKVRNNFATSDILVNDNHSIAIKNDMFQVEYYDKFKESNGTDEVKTRLEFRKLRMNTRNSLTSDPMALCDYWCKLLSSLKNEQNNLIEQINTKLVEKYFKYETHEKQWKNIDEFIRTHTFSIFSSRQFKDLCIRFGMSEEQAINKLKNYKRNNKIEFFGNAELKLYLKFLKKQIKNYYQN